MAAARYPGPTTERERLASSLAAHQRSDAVEALRLPLLCGKQNNDAAQGRGISVQADQFPARRQTDVHGRSPHRFRAGKDICLPRVATH
jgi:hypothetical protein